MGNLVPQDAITSAAQAKWKTVSEFAEAVLWIWGVGVAMTATPAQTSRARNAVEEVVEEVVEVVVEVVELKVLTINGDCCRTADAGAGNLVPQDAITSAARAK